MRKYHPNQKNTLLFEIMDKLNQCNEEMNYHAIRRKSKRLDYIEKNALKIEKFAREIQEVVKTMRRK